MVPGCSPSPVIGVTAKEALDRNLRFVAGKSKHGHTSASWIRGLAGGQHPFATVLGCGDSRVPVVFSWFGFLGVRIPLAYLLTSRQVNLGPLGVVPGADLGLFGAWIAMCTDLWVRGAFFALRFAGGRWKKVEV